MIPKQTDDIILSGELNILEAMAKNVHEVWAESRISQGWTYGPERNDVLKHHPCLVPYEELPEVEKAYDRDTAVGTLKLICKLGFKITKEYSNFLCLTPKRIYKKNKCAFLYKNEQNNHKTCTIE